MGLKGTDYYIRRTRKRKYDLISRDNEQNGKEDVVLHRLPEEDAHGLLFGLQHGWISGATLKDRKKRKNDNASQASSSTM